LLASTPLALMCAASPAKAVRDGPPAEVDPISPFTLDDVTEDNGWKQLDSGLAFKVTKVGAGDAAKGIFDKVEKFQPFPFVLVQYTAYKPNGKPFASTVAERRPYSYQVGIRQEIQDEDGAVMSMVVGERRQFVVGPEIFFKRKLFGNLVPQNEECLLVDVELLSLQPY